MSLRWRLTLYYGVLCALILLLGNFALFLALRSSLHQSLDTSLQEAAQLAMTQLDDDNGKTQIETPTERLQAQLPGATTLTVFDAKGQHLDRFGTLQILSKLEIGFQTIEDIRIYTQAIPKGGWIQAARSQIETINSLTNAAQGLLISIPIVLCLGLIAGYIISDRALRPVDAVTRLALSIATSGKSDWRVPQTNGNDEMARLTQTVNAMLEKLEHTIERERAFALAAAHELRTPLTVLRGRTSLTLERTRTPQEYQNALRELEETATDLNTTIESLLALARSYQPIQLQKLSLSDLVFDTVESLQHMAATKSIGFELNLEPSQIKADPSSLRIAIYNLLENAIKYGQPDGHIWVSLESNILSIADDGNGIAATDLERLQQPFQRGTNLQSIAGSGLGLALVAAVVSNHRAALKFGQAKQGGLRIEITFEAMV